MLHALPSKPDRDGRYWFRIKYLSGVLQNPVARSNLAGNRVLRKSILLKNGPSFSVVRLTNREGEELYHLVKQRNPETKFIWPELETIATEQSTAFSVIDYAAPSRRQYVHVLQDGVLSEAQLRALQALYNFPEHSATAPQLAAVLGYKGFGGANIVMGGAGRRISKELGIAPPWASDKHPNWFSIVANAVGTDIGCLWVMRPELASALEKTKLIDPSIGVDIFPDESAGQSKHEEGSRFRVEVNIYERSREARKKCVSHYGERCSVCNFDFESAYGALGKGFIHVHHLVPLSKITKSYVVDPVRDLRPVCPNCHAMIHRRKPAFSINELKKQLKQQA